MRVPQGSTVTEKDERMHRVVNNRPGALLGCKYCECGEPRALHRTMSTVQLQAGAATGRIEVWQ